MTRRMKLILTRPVDDSLEAFVSFREITALKLTNRKKVFIKDDLISEWKKFWGDINKTSSRKICLGNFLN